MAGTVEVFGRAIPEYDLFLIVVGPLVLVALTWLVTRTRFGILIRAASENRTMTAALGIDEARLFTAVFALGAFLAGLAGALQLPREPANLGMDLAIIAEAFVVTVVGGLGSIPGAFLAALIIGLTKALCIALGTVEIAGIAFAFPKLTLVAEFVVMAVVLALKPHGLLGAPPGAPVTTPLPEQRALVTPPGRARGARSRRRRCWRCVALPWWRDEYALVLATDILIAALFAASLQFLLGTGGMTSFGHAAYFGVGAYAAALAVKAGWPMLAAVAAAPVAALLAALAVRLVLRAPGRRLSRDADARVRADRLVDRVPVGRGDRRLERPRRHLARRVPGRPHALLPVRRGGGRGSRSRRSCRSRARRSASRCAAAATRRCARRRSASTCARTQWYGFALAGAFAGLAGGLFAFSKGSISPESLAIPRSVDALVMVLLGGLNALFGPLLGAAAFTWLADALARATDYWRAGLGALILLIVLVFPMGIGGAFARVLRATGRAMTRCACCRFAHGSPRPSAACRRSTTCRSPSPPPNSSR